MTAKAVKILTIAVVLALWSACVIVAWFSF